MLNYLQDLLGEIWVPLGSLAISLAGIVLALQLSAGEYIWVAMTLASAIVLSALISWIGESLLPRQPLPALLLFEIWILAPAAISALGGAGVILVTVNLTVPETVSGIDKESVKAVAAAVTAFLTSFYITGNGARAASRHASRIYRSFHNNFVRENDTSAFQEKQELFLDHNKMYVKSGSNTEFLIELPDIDGLPGWGFQARWKRARALAQRIAADRKKFALRRNT